jgi:hypothetical protein
MRTKRITFALLALLLIAAAPSPNPIPTPYEARNPPKHQRASKEQIGTQNQTPAQHPSPGFYVIQAPTPAPPSNTPRNHNSKESSPDWWLVWLTGGLVLFSFFQFLTMQSQARYMRKGLEDTKSTAEAARKSAEAAIDNANAAKKQVTTLEKTLAATEKAANAAKASADIAARSDRPVLVAENFVPQNIDRTRAVHNDPVTLAEFQIKNCGKGPALTVELVGNIKLASELPYPPDFGDCKEITLRNKVVEASKEISASMPYASDKPAILLHPVDSKAVENGQISLFVYGWISYRDIHGNRYDTRFSVKYLPVKFGGSERFYPEPEEYNHHNEYGQPKIVASE